MHLQRRHLLIGSAAALAGLGGCASLNSVRSDVASYGEWPAGRSPGRYLVERLPSQQAQGDRSGLRSEVEEGAHAALQKAGFVRVADFASADVVVQIGARITRFDVSPWHDPLWWRWGPRYWRGPGWVGPGWVGPRPLGASIYGPVTPAPEREVAILLRDRASSQPLWEARATSSGSATGPAIFEAMFTAALSGFPTAQPQPRSVTIQLPG